MNDESQIKEYLKKLEHLRLADSSRVRMREDLLAHARFHTVKKEKTTKTIPSPFFNFFMHGAPVALGMVLLVGTTAFYLHKDTASELAVVDSVTEGTKNTDVALEEEHPATADAGEKEETNIPTTGLYAPSNDVLVDDVVAMNTRAKSAPAPEADTAEVASDEMFMTTELSAGTWSIAEHQADVTKRIDGLRTIIKKYDDELALETKTEFTAKLDAAGKLKIDAEGKAELDARTSLDKASVLVGEVEASLSLLGEVIVEDGYIMDIKLP